MYTLRTLLTPWLNAIIRLVFNILTVKLYFFHKDFIILAVGCCKLPNSLRKITMNKTHDFVFRNKESMVYYKIFLKNSWAKEVLNISGRPCLLYA